MLKPTPTLDWLHLLSTEQETRARRVRKSESSINMVWRVPSVLADSPRRVHLSLLNSRQFYPAGVFAGQPSTKPYLRGVASRYAYADEGNARRLVDQHGHNLRFCYRWGS
jgi:hypothetical protein